MSSHLKISGSSLIFHHSYQNSLINQVNLLSTKQYNLFMGLIAALILKYFYCFAECRGIAQTKPDLIISAPSSPLWFEGLDFFANNQVSHVIELIFLFTDENKLACSYCYFEMG
jgi:hypothetical protein